MKKESDWTVNSVLWQKQIAEKLKSGGEPCLSENEIFEKFQELKKFLLENDLLSDPLEFQNRPVDEIFSLKASDLNDLGLDLIKKAHTKWWTKSKTSRDMSILEKAFSKLKSQQTQEQ